jgi:hypothetical protein
MFARRTGQLLQGAALAFLSSTDIRLARRRVLTHVDAASEFVSIVDRAVWEMLEPDADRLHRAGLPSSLRAGSLAFLRPCDDTVDCARVVNRWVAVTRDREQQVRLQAGFGWPWTTTRSCGTDQLNQPDGSRYIRVSVGAVDPCDAKEQATALNATHAAPAPASASTPTAEADPEAHSQARGRSYEVARRFGAHQAGQRHPLGGGPPTAAPVGGAGQPPFGRCARRWRRAFVIGRRTDSTLDMIHVVGILRGVPSSSHNAASSALGYLYQSQWPLLELLRRSEERPDCAITLELHDDVAGSRTASPPSCYS